MADLKFEDVSITYRTSGRNDRGEVHAVKNITLDVPAGTTLGIAGESGSGKSTLVMSVLRLLPKSSKLTGRVLIDGKNVAELSFGEMRAARWTQAAVIFQGAMHSLNPVHTVGQQILEALELHVADEWKTEEARKQRVIDLLESVELPREKANAYPHELSGGQRQRVMIAMALACNPEIIIADEPTTALDVIVQEQILTMISQLVSERGISLVMISHDLSVLATACERIAVMRHGELVEVGPAAQICLNPQQPYTQMLASAFPTIGDPASRMRPVSRHQPGASAASETSAAGEAAGASAESAEKWAGVADDAEVLLDARRVSVTYTSGGRKVPALKEADLQIRRGEIVALVGQSGSGKTTFANTLIGLQQPDAGSEITFAGAPLPTKGRDLKAFHSRVQMVFQDPSAALNPKLTVYEQIAEGLRVQGYTGNEEERVRQSLIDAELTPPERYIGAIPQELSGGQRQRVVIAGALALEPELLIADEPVASLDASVRGEILGLLLSLRQRLGFAALVITHDLGLAWNIADSVAVMHRGQIVEYGPTEEVLLNPQHSYTIKLLEAAPSIADVAQRQR